MSTESNLRIADGIRNMLASGRLPGESPPSLFADFAMMRHFVRANFYQFKAASSMCRQARRALKRLGDSPFNRTRAERIKADIATFETYLKDARELEQDLGRILIDAAPYVDANTTMDQRLELLNCNPSDRAHLDEPNIGLVQLIAVYCVEDSAEHRNDEFRSRPLFEAVNAEIMRVMFDTPEGRAASKSVFDAAFAPGGPLHGVPTYYRQPDGTFKRQAPALVLHDASGARVIEREPT